MTLKEKREFFELIREQDYQLNDNQSADDVLEIAISELGNTDPYIRDELALEVAAYMIYKDYLSEEKLKSLAKRLLSDEFLFFGLKEKKEDSVFKRTFTSLLLAMLFRIPGKANIFTDDELDYMYSEYLKYLIKEYDYRGYIENKGWAHFFAHSSDFLKYLFQQKSFTNDWLKKYFDVILKIIQNNQYVFHHNEDERFKNAFVKLLERKDIDESIIFGFLRDVINYEKTSKFPEDINSFVNVKNIIREIFFSLDDTNQDLKELIIDLNTLLKIGE